MSKRTDVSVDIESFGTGQNAAVVAIGAVKFDIITGEIEPKEFYCAIRLQSALDIGAVVDGDTIQWWMEQSDEARAALFEFPMHINEVLQHFAKFMPGKCRLWGNGSNFDNRLIREMYALAGIKCPWHWRDDRDMRTLSDSAHMLGWDRPFVEFEGDKHNALDDARFQAKCIHALWAQIQKGVSP